MSKSALLVGRGYGLAWRLPALLARAEFQIDGIFSSRYMLKSRFLKNCKIVPDHYPLAPALREALKKNYDWVIATEDGTLNEILQSGLTLEEKLKALPVTDPEGFTHLYSKIGLALAFAKHSVPTPITQIALNRSEALLKAAEIGYPVLLKQNASGGGAGVLEAHLPEEINAIADSFFCEPLVVQPKLQGEELDLSAIYCQGELVHFSYAKIEKVCGKFGPSFLRTYSHLSRVDRRVFEELALIGRTLKLHGFTNISCMQQQNKRFYFEVDARPNVWIEAPLFFGEDPAIRIQKWFSNRETLTFPIAASRSVSLEQVIL